MKTPGLAILGGGALFFASWTAAADGGRFPMSNQIIFSPTDPQLVVLRTTYGILRSHDDGSTWSFLCTDALGLGRETYEDPSIGLTRNNSLLAGVSLGLNVSPDVGCNWSCIGGSLAGQTIVGLAVRPDSPSRAVAITGSHAEQGDSGQFLAHSQVFETADDGVTWTPLGTPIDPRVDVTTVAVAKTDPNRLYVSGTRGYGSGRSASLFVSTNRGQTWTERPLPASQYDPSAEDSIFIGGVDPTTADRLYIRSSGLLMGGRSRLIAVTLAANAAPSLSTAHLFHVGATDASRTGKMLGFALSSDGSKVYIGSDEDGLWVAQASDLKFHKNSSIRVQCLATRGAELWACSDAVSGFVAGVSTDDGKTFTSKLPLIGALSGPIGCPPDKARVACGQDANGSQCRAAYEAFCSMESCESPDASQSGEASQGSDTSRSGSTSASSSSSCNLAVGRGGSTDMGAAFALAAIAWRRRKGAALTRFRGSV